MGWVLKQTKKEHESCFGDVAYSFSTAGISWKLWHVTGTLATEWCQPNKTGLFEKIREILDANRASLRPRSSFTNAKAPSYALHCFLFGAGKSFASPCVTIVSASKHVRDAAKQIIKQHGILKELGFEFVRLSAFITRSMDASDEDEGPSPDERGRLFNLDSLTEKDYDRFFITAFNENEFDTVVGLSIAVRSENHRRAATIGGLIEIDGATYGMTAAHAFCDSFPDETNDKKIQLDERDCPELPPDMTLSTETQREEEGLMTHETVAEAEEHDAAVPYGDEPQPSMHGPYLTSSKFSWDAPYLGTLHFLSRPELDYALVRMDSGPEKPTSTISNSFPVVSEKGTSIKTSSKWSESPPADGSRAIIISGSGVQTVARALETPSMLYTGNSDRSTSVWTLSQIDTRKGISGSWAFSWPEADWLGMVVATCSPLRTAYLVPARDLVQDIQSVVSPKIVALPTPGIDTWRLAIRANAVSYLSQIASGGHAPSEPIREQLTTSMYIAAQSGNISALRTMFYQGADVNKGMEDVKKSLLSFASEVACVPGINDVLRSVAPEGASSQRYNKSTTTTPLFAAILAGNAETVQYLIEHGALLDDIYVSRHKPTMIAETPQLLEDYGAEEQATVSEYSESAEDVELKFSNDEIFHILEAARGQAARGTDLTEDAEKLRLLMRGSPTQFES